MLHRRRRAAVLAVLMLAAGLVIVDLARGNVEPRSAGRPARVVAPPPTLAGTVAPASNAPESALRFPVVGPGTFAYAAGPGPVHGASGPLRRFRVAVENGAGQVAGDFAADVDRIFADPRGWTTSGVRLQRVAKAASAEFTIFLATPGTSEKMCATGGLHTERFTSCRLPGQVIINLARWWRSVPGYGAPLADYQAYAINHEVGHQMGLGHEACPGSGAPAPVMQQQTLGLKGCVANGWPYLDGRRYSGAAIP
jgi:hypothetical protein